VKFSQGSQRIQFSSLPCEGEGWGGVLMQNQIVKVYFDRVLTLKTPSQPPPSQGEELKQSSEITGLYTAVPPIIPGTNRV